MQFRIEEVLLSDDLRYFLSTPHWLDALTPPLEKHIGRLETALRALLGTPTEESGVTAALLKHRPRHVAQRLGAAFPSSEG